MNVHVVLEDPDKTAAIRPNELPLTAGLIQFLRRTVELLLIGMIPPQNARTGIRRHIVCCSSSRATLLDRTQLSLGPLGRRIVRCGIADGSADAGGVGIVVL